MSAAPLTSPFSPLPSRDANNPRADDVDTDADADAEGEAGRGPDAFRLWLAVRNGRPRAIRYPAESRRIMVGVDFSGASDLAINLVAGIAATTNTLVDLVHVFDGFTEAFVRGNPSILDRVDRILANVGRALRMRALATAAQGVRCVSSSLTGAPGIELTRHARATGADLLVLGIGIETSGPLGRAWSADAARQALRLGGWHERPPAMPASWSSGRLL